MTPPLDYRDPAAERRSRPTVVGTIGVALAAAGLVVLAAVFAFGFLASFELPNAAGLPWKAGYGGGALAALGGAGVLLWRRFQGARRGTVRQSPRTRRAAEFQGDLGLTRT